MKELFRQFDNNDRLVYFAGPETMGQAEQLDQAKLDHKAAELVKEAEDAMSTIDLNTKEGREAYTKFFVDKEAETPDFFNTERAKSYYANTILIQDNAAPVEAIKVSVDKAVASEDHNVHVSDMEDALHAAQAAAGDIIKPKKWHEVFSHDELNEAGKKLLAKRATELMKEYQVAEADGNAALKTLFNSNDVEIPKEGYMAGSFVKGVLGEEFGDTGYTSPVAKSIQVAFNKAEAEAEGAEASSTMVASRNRPPRPSER